MKAFSNVFLVVRSLPLDQNARFCAAFFEHCFLTPFFPSFTTQNGIQEVEWHVFVATPLREGEKGKEKVRATFDLEAVRDPILRAFLRLLKEGVACSWRYSSFEQRAEERGFREVRIESDSEEEEEEGMEKRKTPVEEVVVERVEEKELWVFASVKGLPSAVADELRSLTGLVCSRYSRLICCIPNHRNKIWSLEGCDGEQRFEGGTHKSISGDSHVLQCDAK